MIEIREITPDISIGSLDLSKFSVQNNILLKRESEKRGARFVLDRLMAGTRYDLCYTPENKPYLADSPLHISISHSHDRLVVITNKSEATGIDIELIRDKVLKIRHKFMNSAESSFAGSDIEKLITIWASKEAMYKWHGLKSLDFKTNLFVEDFDDALIFGKIETGEYSKRLQLVREKRGDYMMVYILKVLD